MSNLAPFKYKISDDDIFIYASSNYLSELNENDSSIVVLCLNSVVMSA